MNKQLFLNILTLVVFVGACLAIPFLLPSWVSIGLIIFLLVIILFVVQEGGNNKKSKA